MKDERTRYVETLSAQMVEWEVQIDRLRDKAEAASAEVRLEYAQTIDALQLKRDQAAKKLEGIAMVSEDEWEDMKEGAEQIWDEVKGLLSGAIKKPR